MRLISKKKCSKKMLWQGPLQSTVIKLLTSFCMSMPVLLSGCGIEYKINNNVHCQANLWDKPW
jgi:hypothetical protein